jgi:hypothetical protein
MRYGNNSCKPSSFISAFSSCLQDSLSFKCMHQDVPEYETGFYLASYKCVCRKNYELPFADMGTNYFEGATVEKEYEKKIKGETNIFDRLKCRRVLKSRSSESAEYSSNLYNDAVRLKSNINFSMLSFSLVFRLCYKFRESYLAA